MADFPPHVFARAIDQDLILFDTASDRYQAMPGAVACRADRPSHASSLLLLPGAAVALRAADLLVDQASAEARIAMKKPHRAHSNSDTGLSRLTLIDLWYFAASMIVTAWRLWRRRSCTTFAPTRSAAHDRMSDHLTTHELFSNEMADALNRLGTLRLIIPSPRRCLPKCLIAASFLERRGYPIDIVFGVRSHPFAAHCWIESQGVVLDDDLDRVCAFHPIAVGRL